MPGKKPSALDRQLELAGFATYDQVVEAVGMDRRTFWRWRKGGVPKRRSSLLANTAAALKTTPKKLLRMLHLHRAAG